MPLNFSAAHSSRITKKTQAKNLLLKRSSSLPFTDLNRRKPVQRSKSKPETLGANEDFSEDHLDDVGLVKTLATDLSLRDVTQAIKYVQANMFDNVPDSSGGFSSTRISEILNFRRSLPPTVTVTHVHALLPSSTSTEREISTLIRASVVRKLIVPGRGTGGSSAGDGLILAKDMNSIIRGAKDINDDLADKFLKDLTENPTAQFILARPYTATEITLLMHAGLLTSTSAMDTSSSLFTRTNARFTPTVTSIASISRGASGSLAAIGGENAIHDAGGRGGIRRASSDFESRRDTDGLQLSLPAMGPYLRLLTTARSHLVSLIMKSRFREMPIYLLKERWNGGISADDPTAKAKRYRGEFAGVLPARTRKWKQFHGLSFDWILAECVGAGLVELFETGSVGRAARML